MRPLLPGVVALLFACMAWAADVPSAAPVSGKVLEVKDVESYTYLRLKTKDGEIWAAVNKAPVKVGADVAIANPQVMTNFESKTLKKTFDRIVFGSLAAPGAAAASKDADMGSLHAGMAKPVDVGDVKVAKAAGPDARTVAEVNARRTDLKGKPVAVRGKVVKFTPGVMGKNWIHLRDGSGAEADGSNDIVVTTLDETKIGDVVLVKGIVATDRDLGSGYKYKVLIEEAKLEK
ncbi:MAG: nucleotide-binding protein [Burkholderiales bacterium]